MTLFWDTEKARFSTCTVDGMPAMRAFRSGWWESACRHVGAWCVAGCTACEISLVSYSCRAGAGRASWWMPSSMSQSLVCSTGSRYVSLVFGAIMEFSHRGGEMSKNKILTVWPMLSSYSGYWYYKYKFVGIYTWVDSDM